MTKAFHSFQWALFGVWFIPQRQFCFPKLAHLALWIKFWILQQHWFSSVLEGVLTHLKFENRSRSFLPVYFCTVDIQIPSNRIILNILETYFLEPLTQRQDVHLYSRHLRLGRCRVSVSFQQQGVRSYTASYPSRRGVGSLLILPPPEPPAPPPLSTAPPPPLTLNRRRLSRAKSAGNLG